MTRALGTRHSALGGAIVVAGLMAGCTGDKARADSVAAAAQRDSVAAAAVAATNAALATKARDDSIAAAKAKTRTGVTKTGTTKTGDLKTGGKQGVLGRDSVRQGPIIGLPSIKDTAKRRPPR